MSRIFCLTPTPEVQLDHFLHHTPKLRIPVEMVQFLMKLLLKQRILAVYHDFHWVLVAIIFLTAKLYSLYVKESESGRESEILEKSKAGVGVRSLGKVGVRVEVGHFTSDSATLLKRFTVPCIHVREAFARVVYECPPVLS